MATDLVKALVAEIDALETALRNDPRWAKLEDAKRLLARYDPRAPVSSEHTIAPPAPRKTKGVTGRSSPRSPERQAILDAASEFIVGATAPVPTSDIFAFVSARMTIPGTVPKNNLSAMLSNSPRFISHGRAGWTLAPETTEASDDLLTRATSEASISSPALPAGEPGVRPVDPVPGGGT